MSHSGSVFVPAQLDSLELVRVRLALLAPFVAAHGTEHERDVVLVHAIGRDRDGWGECSTLSTPTYSGEHTDEAWKYLSTEAVPRVLAARGNRVAVDPDRPMAWCGVSVALADLDVAPLFPVGALSPEPRRAVLATRVLGRAGTIDELAGRARAAVESGLTSIKVKIEPGWDVEPLGAVREAVPDVRLAADANGSFASVGTEGLAALGLGRFGLSYLEQPFGRDDLASHAEVSRRGEVPIALDESIGSLDDLGRVIEVGAAAAVNVKPARLGGLRQAYSIAVAASDAGLDAFVGGMLETGVGRSAALHLAALPVFSLPTDLGPSSQYFTEDVTEPIRSTQAGEVIVPDSDRLVLRPRPERLAEVTVDRVVVER